MSIPLLPVGLGDDDLETGALDIAEHVEQRGLAGGAVLLALHGGIDDVLGIVAVDEVHELATRITRRVEGPALDERLDDATVGLARIHALDEVVQVLEGAALLALLDDRLGNALAHAADTGQAEAHALRGPP